MKEILIDGKCYVEKECKEHGHVGKLSLKYAIVRSRDQGVVCGFIKSIVGRQVTVLEARQIYKYDCAFVLPDLAEKGIRNPENNKFSCAMSKPLKMLEACGVLYCSSKAAKDLMELPSQDFSDE